jgi:hypothetical protein
VGLKLTSKRDTIENVFNPAIFTIAIYNCDAGQGSVPFFKGSGVLVIVDEKPMVLTAAHVFNEGGFS